MARNAVPDSTHTPLTPATFHILMALAGGERHGYAIMKEVEAESDGNVRLGPGTLYGSLKRLLDAGLVDESAERSDDSSDERRRYYRLSSAGRESVLAETKRLSRLVAFAHKHARHAVFA